MCTAGISNIKYSATIDISTNNSTTCYENISLY